MIHKSNQAYKHNNHKNQFSDKFLNGDSLITFSPLA